MKPTSKSKKNLDILESKLKKFEEKLTFSEADSHNEESKDYLSSLETKLNKFEEKLIVYEADNEESNNYLDISESKLKNLEESLLKKMEPNEPTKKCVQCDDILFSKTGLVRHIKTKHCEN